MDGMVPETSDVAPWRDWSEAACRLLQYLYETIGWDLWAVTRVEGDHQVVLHAHPTEAVRPGLSLPWEESFCRAMVTGEAPRVATVTAAVPAYSSRTMGPLAGVAAYIGVPLVARDLQVWGSLCGLAFRAQPRSATRDLPRVEMVARTLSTLLAAGMTPKPVEVVNGERDGHLATTAD